MKILFISNKSEFGGAPKCMLELIELLTRFYNIEVEVVTYGDYKISAWCRERNIKYYAVGHVPFAIGKGSTPVRRFGKTILTPMYYAKSYLQNKKAFNKACQMIDFSSIDIIHTNSNRDCLGAMLAQKYNIPHVWHLREFGKEDYDIRYLMSNYIGFMNKTTDYFIAISEAVKKVWIEKGIDKDKIVRIYDGIKMPDREVIEKAEKHKKENNDQKVKFAYLGIVCPSKGQFDAVKALDYLPKEILKNIQVDFWGDCDCLPEFTQQMKIYAKEHGYPDAISFKGFSNNVWNELPNYDGALVCSRAEAFGRITPEYMSIGLQVIASDTGANPELVEDGVSGYLYNHADLKDLASKILTVYRSSNETKRIISNNAQKRSQMFSDKIHASKISEFYTNIVSNANIDGNQRGINNSEEGRKSL